MCALPLEVPCVAGGGVIRPLFRDIGVAEDSGVAGDGVTSCLWLELWIGVQAGNSFSKDTLLRGVLVLTWERLVLFAGGEGEMIPLSWPSLSSSMISGSGDGTLDFLIADFAGVFDTNREAHLGVDVLRPFVVGVVFPSTSESGSIIVTS